MQLWGGRISPDMGVSMETGLRPHCDIISSSDPTKKWATYKVMQSPVQGSVWSSQDGPLSEVPILPLCGGDSSSAWRTLYLALLL